MQAILIQGLFMGDEGKGTCTEALTQKTKAKFVVRFNGGSQAGHHISLEDGFSHCFSQFGSGTLSGANTYLSKYMMFDPLSCMKEAEHLLPRVPDVYKTLYLDPEAPIITPYHRVLNRTREEKRDNANKHGSVGLGIGELANDILFNSNLVIRAKDLKDDKILREKLYRIRSLKADQVKDLRGELDFFEDEDVLGQCLYKYLKFVDTGVDLDGRSIKELFEASETLIFEGAQGVLLDQWHGFHPNTTWSDCTFNNAFDLLGDTKCKITKIGVLRTYLTRHGIGLFPTEDKSLLPYPGEHNKTGEYQGDFRLGYFDFPLYRYAVDCLGGVDCLALTWCDILKDHIKVCDFYYNYDDCYRNYHSFSPTPYPPKNKNDKLIDYQTLLKDMIINLTPEYKVLDKNSFFDSFDLGITSYGPMAKDKFFHRNFD